ncbi:MAG: hypothetical protein MI674_07760 [Cytophagales bacterium]|nr:hypothetical protein [Cytophagales bacterium]
MLYKKAIFIIIPWILTIPLQAKKRITKSAIVALEKGELPTAQHFIEQAVGNEKTKLQGKTWYYRGIVYEELSKQDVSLDSIIYFLDEALASYNKALSLTKEKSQYHSFSIMKLDALWASYLNRGVRYYRREAYDRAIESFAICKKIKPTDSSAYLYTAIAAHQDENYALAIENYEQYLALGYTSPEVYYGLASIIEKHLQEQEKALSILNEGLQQYPLNNELNHASIQLLQTLNKVEEKERQLKDKIAEEPSHITPYYQLAYLYETLGKQEEATAYYTQALAIDANLFEPNFQLAVIYYNQAAQVISRIDSMAMDAFQEQGEQLTEVANSYLYKALPLFEKANASQPHELLILESLRSIYVRLNMTEKIKEVEKTISKLE